MKDLRACHFFGRYFQAGPLGKWGSETGGKEANEGHTDERITTGRKWGYIHGGFWETAGSTSQSWSELAGVAAHSLPLVIS